MPELLSKAVKETPLTEDNILLDVLVEQVANILLNLVDYLLWDFSTLYLVKESLLLLQNMKFFGTVLFW